MSINSKRNGPRHRVRSGSNDRLCNDGLEALFVASMLLAGFGLAAGLYFLAQAI